MKKAAREKVRMIEGGSGKQREREGERGKRDNQRKKML